MRVLVACEFSGAVRDAFRRAGHAAISCDLPGVEPEGEFVEWHAAADVMSLRPWMHKVDLLVAHPPCTYLATSGSRWFKDRMEEQRQALDFVRALMGLGVPRIAIENPVSVISTYIRKPDQIIQPWQFGHPETKKTCLWLDGLPKLVPTKVVTPEYVLTGKDGKGISRIHAMCGPNRQRERSRTYAGIAQAMADQWGCA